MCISWIGGKHKVASISHMCTQIWPYCVCKCGICSCSLPCRRLLTPSMGLDYHVLFGNPSCFYGNRRAVRGIETRGKRDAQRGFGMHRAWKPAHPWMPVPKRLERPSRRGAPTGFLPLNLSVAHWRTGMRPAQGQYGCAGVAVFTWHTFPQHGLGPMAVVSTGAAAVVLGMGSGVS